MATTPNIRLVANNEQFIAAMRQASGSVGAFTAKLSTEYAAAFKAADSINKRWEQGIGRLAGQYKAAGQALSTYITLPMGLTAGAALNAYKEYDALSRSLEVVEGSAEGAARRIKELKEVAKMPGLGLQEAIQGDVLLRAQGFDARMSERAMQAFGNAVAAGGGGKEAFSRVLMQLGQMAASGKVMAEDLKPIIENAPLVAKSLRELFGTVSAEDISKRLKAQGKNSADFIALLTAQLEKAPRVTGGFKNSLENLQDTLFVVGAQIGEVIDKNAGLAAMTERAAKVIEDLGNWFSNLSPEAQRTALALVATTAAAGPLLFIFGQLMGSVTNIVSGFNSAKIALSVFANPIAASVIAVAALAAGLYSLYRSYNPVITEAAKLSDVNKQAQAQIAGEVTRVQRLQAIIVDETKAKKERVSAIRELQQINPQYFSGLDTERIKVDQVKRAVNDYTNELLKAATAKAAQGRLEELSRADLDDMERRNQLWEKYKNLSKDVGTGPGANAEAGNYVDSMRDEAAREMRALQAQMNERKKAKEELAKLISEGGSMSIGAASTGGTGGGGGNNTFDKETKKVRDDTQRLLDDLQRFRADANATEIRNRIGAAEDRARIARTEVEGLIASEELKKIRLVQIEQELQDELLRIRQEAQLKTLSFHGQQSPLQTAIPTIDWAGRGLPGMDEVLGRGQEQMDAKLQPLRNFIGETNSLLQQGAMDAAEGMANVIGAMASGAAGVQDIPKMLLGVVGGMFQQLGKAYIAYGITSKLTASLLSNPFTAGFGAIAAGVAFTALGAGLRAAVNGGGGRRQFASGGVLYGRVFGAGAEAGEYPGAALNDPEIVSPLSKFGPLIAPTITAAVASAFGRMNTPVASGMTLSPTIIVNQDPRGTWTQLDGQNNYLRTITGR